jgi:flagellin-specific chaperone FliS
MHTQQHAVGSGADAALLATSSLPRNRVDEALQTYRNEHLSNLSPVQVVLKLYDIALQGCKKQNYGIAQRALTELILALNFDHKELATGLFQLYDYAKRSIRQGQVDEAITILEELRAAWAEAFHL